MNRVPSSILLSLFIISLAVPLIGANDVDRTTERVLFIQERLDAGEKAAQAWWYGWISGYSAATVAQGTLAWTHRDDFRRGRKTDYVKKRNDNFSQDMVIGSATTFLGTAALLIDPFTPAYAPEQLRRLPAVTPEERHAKLKRAEELLKRCAEQEKGGWGWLPHTLNLGVNLTAGLVTWLAFHRPWYDGLLTFGLGEAVSLANIYSQPRRAIKDWREYEERYAGPPPTPGKKTGHQTPAADDELPEWFFSVTPGGLVVGIRF